MSNVKYIHQNNICSYGKDVTFSCVGTFEYIQDGLKACYALQINGSAQNLLGDLLHARTGNALVEYLISVFGGRFLMMNIQLDTFSFKLSVWRRFILMIGVWSSPAQYFVAYFPMTVRLNDSCWWKKTQWPIHGINMVLFVCLGCATRQSVDLNLMQQRRGCRQ